MNWGGDDLVPAGDRDIAIGRFSTSGAHVWSNRYGSAATDDGPAARFNSQGNILITGFFTDAIDFGGGAIADTTPADTDLFLAMLDSDGTELLTKGFPGGFSAGHRWMVADLVGGFFTCGAFQNSIVFDPFPLTSQDGRDAYLVRFNDAGNAVWARSFSGPGDQWCWGAATHTSGSPVIGGHYDQSITIGNQKHTAVDGRDAYIALMAN